MNVLQQTYFHFSSPDRLRLSGVLLCTGQLEAKASLTDLKGQIAVSIIVNQPTLRGIFPGVFGEPVLRAVL